MSSADHLELRSTSPKVVRAGELARELLTARAGQRPGSASPMFEALVASAVAEARTDTELLAALLVAQVGLACQIISVAGGLLVKWGELEGGLSVAEAVEILVQRAMAWVVATGEVL